MEELTWVDNVIFVIIGLSVLLGVFRGFVKEAMSLITWITAMTLGIVYCEEVSTWFTAISVTGIRLLVSFLLIALLVLIFGGIINYLISQIIKTTRFTLPDRIVGILFGFVRGLFIVTIAYIIVNPTPIGQELSWKNSASIPKIEPLALWLEDKFPKELLNQYLHPFDKETEIKTTIQKEEKKVMDPKPEEPSHENLVETPAETSN